jgi:hypothetical protein
MLMIGSLLLIDELLGRPEHRHRSRWPSRTKNTHDRVAPCRQQSRRTALTKVDFASPDPPSCLTECLACFRHRQMFTGSIMQNPTAGIPPAIMSVKDASQWSHLSRSEVYRQLAACKISAIDLGIFCQS